MFKSQGIGIDCPRCSDDPKADPEKTKIRTSLLELVAMRSAHCENCGLLLKLVMDEKGKEALQLASTLKQTLDASEGAMRSH